MKRRQSFNAKRYSPIHGGELLSEMKKKSSVDMLFEKIKIMEQHNRETKTAAAENGQGAQMDANLQMNCEKSAERAGSFHVIKQEEGKEMERTEIGKLDLLPEHENPQYYIVSDERLAKTVEYRRIIEEFVEMMESVVDQFSYCNSKVSESDRELQDFLHELRMPKRNACEGFKLYQLGHHLEVKRQGFKDVSDDIRPLSSFAASCKEQTERLKGILKYMEQQQESRDNRIYMPRSSLKLPVGDKFRALPKEKQEEIRRNYDMKRQQKRIA